MNYDSEKGKENQQLARLKSPSEQTEEAVSVSEAARVVLGGTPRSDVPEYWNGDIKWAAAKDIANSKSRYLLNTERRITQNGVDNSAAKVLPRDTIIITARGTVGQLALLSEPMAFNQTCYGLITKEKVLPLFLYYKLKSILIHIDSVSYGTVFKTITKRTFDEIKIRIPTMRKQKEIVNMLNSLDSKTELNVQINRTLEAIGQALFKHWFIDFEFPDVDGKPYKSSGGEMVDSELGEIPKDWRINRLEDMARIVDCLHSKKPLEQGNKRVLLQVYNIGESGKLDMSDLYFISEEDYNEWIKRTRIKEGDIIISKTGRVGAIAQIPEGFEGAIGRNLVCIRNLDHRIGKGFLKEYMLSSAMKKEISIKTHVGTVLQSIHVKEIEKLRILVPTKDLIRKYEKIIDPFHKEINQNILKNQILSSIRDTLLAKLMSGEIQVGMDEREMHP